MRRRPLKQTLKRVANHQLDKVIPEDTPSTRIWPVNPEKRTYQTTEWRIGVPRRPRGRLPGLCFLVAASDLSGHTPSIRYLDAHTRGPGTNLRGARRP